MRVKDKIGPGFMIDFDKQSCWVVWEMWHKNESIMISAITNKHGLQPIS